VHRGAVTLLCGWILEPRCRERGNVTLFLAFVVVCTMLQVQVETIDVGQKDGSRL